MRDNGEDSFEAYLAMRIMQAAKLSNQVPPPVRQDSGYRAALDAIWLAYHSIITNS